MKSHERDNEGLVWLATQLRWEQELGQLRRSAGSTPDAGTADATGALAA